MWSFSEHGSQRDAKKALLSMLPYASEISKKLEYEFGPLKLKNSTKKLQLIIDSLLDSKNIIEIKSNASEEIIVSINNLEINLSKILAKKPDFSHLEIPIDKMNYYLDLIKGSEIAQMIKGNGTKLQNISENINIITLSNGEMNSGIDSKHLHLAEKVALNIYSGSLFFADINQFFRTDGKSLATIVPIPEKKIKIILLTGVIASLALQKNNSPRPLSKDKQLCFRADSLPTEELERRIEYSKKYQVLEEKAFYSTSDFKKESAFIDKKEFKIFSLVIDPFTAKPIKLYSDFPEENEKLFPIGTHFAPLAYEKIQDTHYFIYKPVVVLNATPREIPVTDIPKISNNISTFFNSKNAKIALIVSGCLLTAGLVIKSYKK